MQPSDFAAEAESQAATFTVGAGTTKKAIEDQRQLGGLDSRPGVHNVQGRDSMCGGEQQLDFASGRGEFEGVVYQVDYQAAQVSHAALNPSTRADAGLERDIVRRRKRFHRADDFIDDLPKVDWLAVNGDLAVEARQHKQFFSDFAEPNHLPVRFGEGSLMLAWRAVASERYFQPRS